MFPRILLYLSLALGFLSTSALVAALDYAEWTLAVFEFRCKAPNIVEAYSWEWGGWRVSSICMPGTCCATNAVTGPLCTPAACEEAERERERALASYKQGQASRRQAEAERARAAQESQIDGEVSEAEENWREADAQAEAEREQALAEIRFEA